jgi:hypothetical protein
MVGRGQGSLMAWCSRAKHGYRYSRLRTAAAESTQSTVPMTANGSVSDRRMQPTHRLIRTIADRPACRSSPQYILARGRFVGISTARRFTFRHLAATAVSHNAGVESLLFHQIT